MTTEAILPEQRVTTIEEWLAKLDGCNATTEERTVFDVLREELFRLKTIVIPDLTRQLAKFDYPTAADESEGWVGAATIMRNIMATDRRKKAVEAECHRLDSALEEIRQKTSALQEEKRRFVAAPEVPAARPKDESDTKESRKLYRATKRAERAKKRLEQQRARTAEVVAERDETERLCKDSERRWKASKQKLAQSLGRAKETGGKGCVDRSCGPGAAGVVAKKTGRG